MNCWGIFLLISAAVLQIVSTQQSNSSILNVSLCIRLNLLNILNGNCQNDKTNTNSSSVNSNTIDNNEDLADPAIILENGFNDLNNSVVVALNSAMDGYSNALNILTRDSKAAAQIAQKGLQDADDEFYRAGHTLFSRLADLYVLSNYTGAQLLADGMQCLQSVSVKLVDTMRNSRTLVMLGSDIGGNVQKQSIEAASQIIKGGFAAVFNELQNSYENLSKNITNIKSMSMQDRVENQNTDAIANDNDTQAVISEIKKIAEDSINQGANRSKVNIFIENIINSFGEIAQVGSDIKDILVKTQKLAETDAPSAKDIFVEVFEKIDKKSQYIFTTIYLYLGSARIKSDSSSENDLTNAFVAVEHGLDELFYANKIAKELTTSALSGRSCSNKLSLTLSAALDTSRYGILAFEKRLVEAVKIILS